jgi:hypothetical protein
MNKVRSISLDAGYQSQVSEADERAINERISKLLAETVDPIVLAVLRRRFVSTTSRGAFTDNRSDIEDLLSEIHAKLIPVIRKDLSSGEGEGIKDLSGYARSVAINVFRQFVRDKYPQRHRLRNKIRYILQKCSGLELSMTASGEPVAHLSGNVPDSTSIHRISDRDALIDKIRQQGAGPEGIDDNRKIKKIIVSVINLCNGPVLLSDLVEIMSQICGVCDLIDVEDADLALRDIQALGQDPAVRLESREELISVLEHSAAIPLQHRRSLFLNLRGAAGDNALAYFVILRVASIRKLAKLLEFSEEQFSELWNELPIEDIKIAEILGLTRQQVINLRYSAREMLMKRIRGGS